MLFILRQLVKHTSARWKSMSKNSLTTQWLDYLINQSCKNKVNEKLQETFISLNWLWEKNILPTLGEVGHRGRSVNVAIPAPESIHFCPIPVSTQSLCCVMVIGWGLNIHIHVWEVLFSMASFWYSGLYLNSSSRWKVNLEIFPNKTKSLVQIYQNMYNILAVPKIFMTVIK